MKIKDLCQMIKDTVTRFHAQYMTHCVLELSDSKDDTNMYVSKFENTYQLGVNINTIRKMGLNQQELLCLLWHEKGHLDLNHLESEQNILINLVLTVLVGACFVCSSILNLFFPIDILTIVLGFFLFFLSCSYLKSMASMRKKELQADLYASRHCGVESTKSMLIKMGQFYKIDFSQSSVLSTHPSVDKRLDNLMKNPV